jgi:hypothetical protein
MSNWAAWKEAEIGLPVFKRAKHGIHFDAGKGLVRAEFVGKPCHYFDGKEYKAIDTRPLLRKDGTYGCAHSDVIIHTDGTVQVGEYTQRAALIYPGKVSVDGDRIARPFSGGVQYLYITEDGFRQEIVLEKMPDLRKVSALVDTVKGILPTKYTASSLSLKDSSTAELSDFVQVGSKSLASVLEAAKYPVVIDPDFGVATDGGIYGTNVDYDTAGTTSSGTNDDPFWVGQRCQSGTYRRYRSWLIFNTSSIDDGTVITQVNLKLVATANYLANGGEAFDCQISKYLAVGTRETDYDGIFSADADDAIWKNTADVTINTQYASGNLSTAWINKTGNTGYGLRSSRDVSGAHDTDGTFYEYFNFASSENATESYRPVLSVTYTAAGTFIPVNMMANTQNLTAGMRG